MRANAAVLPARGSGPADSDPHNRVTRLLGMARRRFVLRNLENLRGRIDSEATSTSSETQNTRAPSFPRPARRTLRAAAPERVAASCNAGYPMGVPAGHLPATETRDCKQAILREAIYHMQDMAGSQSSLY